MAYKLIITNEGEDRIDSHIQHLLFKLSNESAAIHFLNSIDLLYKIIEDNPYVYAISKDALLASMGYHEATFPDMNYKLIYRIEDDVVYVMGVFNDLENHVDKLR